MFGDIVNWQPPVGHSRYDAGNPNNTFEAHLETDNGDGTWAILYDCNNNYPGDCYLKIMLQNQILVKKKYINMKNLITRHFLLPAMLIQIFFISTSILGLAGSTKMVGLSFMMLILMKNILL